MRRPASAGEACDRLERPVDWTRKARPFRLKQANAANRVQYCGWIEVDVGAGFKPALAQQTRTIWLGYPHPCLCREQSCGPRTPERTSRRRFLPKRGGFEARPYQSRDLCAALAKEGPLETCGLQLRVIRVGCGARDVGRSSAAFAYSLSAPLQPAKLAIASSAASMSATV